MSAQQVAGGHSPVDITEERLRLIRSHIRAALLRLIEANKKSIRPKKCDTVSSVLSVTNDDCAYAFEI